MCLSSCGIWRNVQPRGLFGPFTWHETTFWIEKDCAKSWIMCQVRVLEQTHRICPCHVSMFSVCLRLCYAKPPPPSQVLLPLFCVFPGSDPCRPTQLDFTGLSHTHTSLGFVAEMAFEIHMRHTSTPLIVCRPVVELRHVSTRPQVFCWNSDLTYSAVCPTLRPLV